MASVDVGEQRPARLSKRMWIIVAACAVASIVFVAAINRHALVRFAVRSLGLNLDLGYTVRYVVPDGYRGVFSISEDPVNGVPPGTGNHGELIYSIPDNGHLVTTDTTPLYTRHSGGATYRSGKPIELEGDPSEIRFRGLGVTSRAPSRELVIKDLIGTDQERNDWCSNDVDWFRIEKSDENERRE